MGNRDRVLRRAGVGLVAALVLIFSAGAAAPSAQAVVPNDAVIAYDSGLHGPSQVLVCKNWGTTGCAASSPKKWLANGRDTKSAYGWADADGFQHPGGNCTATVTNPLWSKKSYEKASKTWIKVSGTMGTKARVVVDCPGQGGGGGSWKELPDIRRSLSA